MKDNVTDEYVKNLNLSLNDLEKRVASYQLEHDYGFRTKRLLSDLMIKIGITPNFEAYKLLPLVIQRRMTDDRIPLIHIFGDLATELGMTTEGIERAIRFAIEKAWNKNYVDNIFYLNKLFQVEVFNDREKPTTAFFVCTIACLLKLYLLQQ